MGVAHLFARIAHNRRDCVCFESNPPNMKVYMPWPKRANNSWVYGGFARSDERNKRKGSDSKRNNERAE